MNFLLISTLLLVTSRLPAAAAQTTYTLDTSYSGESLFNEFDFFTGTDPTHGFVNYLDQNSASALGLVSISNGIAYMGVDSTTILDANGGIGRDSVRISSQKSWNHGLFIADIAHMPGGQCGIWPAFWTLGPDWPNNGEVDIIEGVNSQLSNLMSSHTADNCTIAGMNELGTLQTNDCYAYASGNSGCGVSAASTATFGAGFNSNGGGVYAMEWTSSYIRIWFFTRGSTPADISGRAPDPSTWGLPQANFQGSCDVDSHFSNMQLVFDTTFCGDWASNVWSTDATCSIKATTCVEYVAGNPSAYTDSFWAVNSVKVYTSSDDRQQLQAALTPASSPQQGLGVAGSQVNGLPVAGPQAAGPPIAVPPAAAPQAPGPQASQVPVAEGPDGQITAESSPDSSAQSNPNLPVNNPVIPPPPPPQQHQDYLPPITATAIPGENIFGKARGGCACSEDSMSHTTTTTKETVFVDISCSSGDNPLGYGTMAAVTSTTQATQVQQVSEVHTVIMTGVEPSATCEEVPSVTSTYAQISTGAGMPPVSARLGGVGAVLGLIGLVGMVL